ncbi:group III truncated hemoglobin [Helicobacter himalayensis]|uniref:group III truncated hemoglobin n=1 Tax=Helicobacter himalayensis TaxID=1591088 RepID=UPI003D6E1633
MSEITHDSIAKLMDIFYEKVRKDANLAPIFNAKIGESDSKWQHHKKHIGNFWKQMLLGESTFNGQPLKKHLELPPFPRERFDDWLALFEESLHQVYDEPTSAHILEVVRGIAGRFQMMIYDMPYSNARA